MTNALALPEATNRRAVLRAMLVASAVGAIPVAAEAATAAEPVSGPAGLDAGLFALVDEVREAGARGGGYRRLGGGARAHRKSAVAPSVNRDGSRHAHMQIKSWRPLRPRPSSIG